MDDPPQPLRAIDAGSRSTGADEIADKLCRHAAEQKNDQRGDHVWQESQQLLQQARHCLQRHQPGCGDKERQQQQRVECLRDDL